MAIAGIGMGIHSLAQCGKEKSAVEKTSTFQKTNLAHVLNVTDALLGVTLLVVGVLTLLNYIPLPEGWPGPLAFTTMGAGAANLLASSLKACQSSKILYAECKKPAGAIVVDEKLIIAQ